MTTFTIYPSTPEARSAIGAVEQHAKKFNYPHFIKVVGKSNGRVNMFSYISITTDVKKAEEEDYITPELWLQVYKQPVTNRINGR